MAYIEFNNISKQYITGETKIKACVYESKYL